MNYQSELHRQSALATNEFLVEFFADSINQADQISPGYGQLWRHIETIVIHGGKRLRPYLTIVGYGKYDSQSIAEIMPFAAAQELLHAALLVHDDIIDRDDVRRGINNLNGLYKKAYRNAEELDRTHYAYSAAILGGDLLLGAAHSLISKADFFPEGRLAAIDLLYQSIFEVAGGELMDMEASFIKSSDHHALPIAIHKTASYSFIGPLLTGAKLAKKSLSIQSKLRDYALRAGIAFQLQDDLLGVFGDEKELGKSTKTDIHEGKHTFLIEQYKLTDKFDKALFERTFKNPDAPAEDIAQLKSTIEASGARQKTEAVIDNYINEASEILHTMTDDKATAQELLEFTRKLTERKH